MSGNKPKAPKPYRDGIPEDFAPEPTVLPGGISRLIKCWEVCRDANKGGYGSGVVQSIKGWLPKNKSELTSCSPFTATVCGMIFDKDAAISTSTVYEPKYNNGTVALPKNFYHLHNGFYFDWKAKDPKDVELRKKRIARFKEKGWDLGANDAHSSVAFFNLGYLIDPVDMRKGDLVKIEWRSGNGHAVFCWDVHLDANGKVDCFQYLSANGGSADGGPGVSVSASSKGGFIKRAADGTYSKQRDPLFVDSDDYVKFGGWMCIPGITKAHIDRKSFRVPVDRSYFAFEGKFSPEEVKVVRFWGVAPPESPKGDPKYSAKFEQAKRLSVETSPAPYAIGTTKPVLVHVKDVPVTKVKEADLRADAAKTIASAPRHAAKQKKDDAASHQLYVERALLMLHEAKWIDKSPGEVDGIADADTTAAIRDFQTKWKMESTDGIAGPKTRKALVQAVFELWRGKPNPNLPDPKPQITRFYWLRNRVQPGDTTGLAAHGKYLDLFQSFEITLSDKKSGHREKLAARMSMVHGGGLLPVRIPANMPAPLQVTATLEGTTKDGVRVSAKSEVPLRVEARLAIGGDQWPWDESTWPKKMQSRVAELRATPRPVEAAFHVREITQYGVSPVVDGDEVDILDQDRRVIGRTTRKALYKSAIQGTMRYRGRVLGVKKTGMVYDLAVTRVVDGQVLHKKKPNWDKFEPENCLWHDVTAHAPWGNGSKMAVIPFRVLAFNRTEQPSLYGKKVYIEQLDGLKLPTGEVHNGICVVGDCGGMTPYHQFDLFIGPMSPRIHIPTVGKSQGGAACRVTILE